MADVITTLHPEGAPEDNLYPNVRDENVPSSVQRTPVVLWRNTNPSASFGENTITVQDMRSYSTIRVEVRYLNDNVGSFFVDIPKPSVNNALFRLSCVQYDFAGGSFNLTTRERDMLILSNTSVYFKPSTVQGGDSPWWLIPVAIYGIK